MCHWSFLSFFILFNHLILILNTCFHPEIFWFAHRPYNHLNFNLLFVKAYFHRIIFYFFFFPWVGRIFVFLQPPLRASDKLHTLIIYLPMKQTSTKQLSVVKTLNAFWACPWEYGYLGTAPWGKDHKVSWLCRHSVMPAFFGLSPEHGVSAAYMLLESIWVTAPHLRL